MTAKRARKGTEWLWHAKDGGRLFNSTQSGFYCEACDAVVPATESVKTWENISPGPMSDDAAMIHRAFSLD